MRTVGPIAACRRSRTKYAPERRIIWIEGEFPSVAGRAAGGASLAYNVDGLMRILNLKEF
jgi:hypothetical protein